jgi:hypothetical protein
VAENSPRGSGEAKSGSENHRRAPRRIERPDLSAREVFDSLATRALFPGSSADRRAGSMILSPLQRSSRTAWRIFDVLRESSARSANHRPARFFAGLADVSAAARFEFSSCSLNRLRGERLDARARFVVERPEDSTRALLSSSSAPLVLRARRKSSGHRARFIAQPG